MRVCPVCSEADPVPVFNNRLAPVAAHDLSYLIARCANCHFHCAHTLPAAATYAAYYATASKYDFSESVPTHDKLRMDAAVRICSEALESSALIVDIGCGHGVLLNGFKELGYTRLFGIDPAPNARGHAKQVFGLNDVYQGSMSEAGRYLPLREADVVCITAVLEHLTDPRGSLAPILGQLKRGCKVLVEVPALERFDGASGEPFGEFSLEHIQFFSNGSLENFMRSLGARPVLQEIVDLPTISSCTLFGLFELSEEGLREIDPARSFDDAKVMDRYIRSSEVRLAKALERLPQSNFVLYGAGSHTCRLLPRLSPEQTNHIKLIVDGNPNLLGKTVGGFHIAPPPALANYPSLPVLISSFRAQESIAQSLQSKISNPVIRLY
jgi:SAM-dependent methyltransferase